MQQSLKNNTGCRYVLVTFDFFSKLEQILQNENAQTIKDSFETMLETSRRKLTSIETDYEKNMWRSFSWVS